MNSDKQTLQSLAKEHEELQFDSFSPEKAFELGTAIRARALEGGLIVAIDITLNGHQLFHCVLQGTSPDNDRWIRRKSNVVNHFGRSSLYMRKLLEENNQSIDGMYALNPADFAPFGGSFPIIINGSGPVGTITVSGLPDEEDHRLVTSVIRGYLEK